MISFNSIKNFFLINGTALVLTTVHYLVTFPTESLFDDILIQFGASLVKNYFIMDFIDNRIQNKKSIMEEKRSLEKHIPRERFYKEFDLFVFSTTFVDSLTQVLTKKLFITKYYDFQYQDLISFVFLSFGYEICFDFFHYFAHSYLHTNKILYRNFHKVHHKWLYPSCKLTFYNHPFDFIFTNSIPSLLTMFVFPFEFTYFQYELLQTFKAMLEIGGHSGKHLNSSSFTQFIWLPKILGIGLRTEDHDLHHSMNNCNYAKRFTLWDKVFNTYVNYDEVKNK